MTETEADENELHSYILLSHAKEPNPKTMLVVLHISYQRRYVYTIPPPLKHPVRVYKHERNHDSSSPPVVYDVASR